MSLDPYIGEIILVPYNFIPAGWALCAGQELQIARYQALYSLLGTTYGGNGTTTFKLPNLVNRFALGVDDNARRGEAKGNNSITIWPNNLPPHIHPIAAQTVPALVTFTPQASSTAGTTANPADAIWANAYDATTSATFDTFTQDATNSVNMKPIQGTAQASIGQHTTSPNVSPCLPIDVTNPYLGLYYIISLEGIYPSRP